MIKEAIPNPVHYLCTVANNLVKEHAVLDQRQASGIDIDEAAAHEQLETPALKPWSVWRPNTIATLKSRSRSPHQRFGDCKSAGSSPPTTPTHSLPFCAASKVCASR